jgi:hypothetical protein
MFCRYLGALRLTQKQITNAPHQERREKKEDEEMEIKASKESKAQKEASEGPRKIKKFGSLKGSNPQAVDSE